MTKIISCNICGCELVQGTIDTPGNYTTSPYYLGENWPICRDCMVEHCNYTNCYGCQYGKYPECRFLSLKQLQ